MLNMFLFKITVDQTSEQTASPVNFLSITHELVDG